MKVRVFIDFWNLQLNIRDTMGTAYRLDWNKLSPCLVAEAAGILQHPLTFDGTHVYVSFDPLSGREDSLKNWCLSTLDHFPGVSVTLKERAPKSPPTCPHCHSDIIVCPQCARKMAGTIEKGIDTAITTDMISLAWENAWDVALLVSSDQDFVPAVSFLDGKGKRVINVHFPPQGAYLARKCWAGFDLRPLLPRLQR